MKTILSLGALVIAAAIMLFASLACVYFTASGNLPIAIFITFAMSLLYWVLTGRFGNAIVVLLFCGFGIWAGLL